MNCFIKLKNVSLLYPIYGANATSIKRKIASSVTGGRIGASSSIANVKALSNINFELKSGDRLGVRGHNGAGKSTLLRLLASAYFPTSGEYERQGVLASLIDPTMGIEPDATGVENIILRCTLQGFSKRQTEFVIDDVINFSGLGDYLYMPVRTYSTGMLMRLSFSMCTSIKADILLMDEWLSVGDVDFQAKAEKRMRLMLDDVGILILASHSDELIKRECNKFITLEHGHIIDAEGW